MQNIKILLPENSGIYKIAAKEFSFLWKSVTGTTPAIVTVPDEDSDMVIFGADAENRLVHDWIMEGEINSFQICIGSDSYHLRSVEKNGRVFVIFAFGRPRALLYAIYHFFELRASCRYFWDGDKIPRSDSIDIRHLDIAETPRFKYRGLRYFAHRSLDRFQAEHWSLKQWKHELRWIAKKRMNTFMLRLGIDDIFQKAFPDAVDYPEYKIREAKERSYDDRNLFWSMKKRAALRKQILAYAQQLDLMHPEDVGTMTHWYSRTPQSFLERFKPEFLAQSSSAYAEQTGLVWDIRKDENLENYFKLTQAHIKHYGSPSLFHTIGLAERDCFEDKTQNHKMKLYAYRRIISRLRKTYPDAPLLIGSWDFSVTWKPEEVSELIRELNPDNTIIFDYTADVADDKNCFLHWNVVGKFPWIFGIFHAYEPASEPRGHYDLLAKRIEVAKSDPMCKGLMLWPECSHSDTLMLEYLSANSWNPSGENIKIESFLEKFAEARYMLQDVPEMLAIWRSAIAVVKCIGWPPPRGKNILYAGVSDPLFRIILFDFMSELSEKNLHLHQLHVDTTAKAAAQAPLLLELLAKRSEKYMDKFVFRDIIDLARTAVSRIQIYGFSKLAIEMEKWRNDTASAKDIKKLLKLNRNLISLEKAIIDSHEDYSIWDSLCALNRKYQTNPDFEYTLKGNAENSYCRSYASELFKTVYLPEFDVYEKWVVSKLDSDDKSPWQSPTELFKAELENIRNNYYETPLREMAPDHIASRNKLQEKLIMTAKTALAIIN